MTINLKSLSAASLSPETQVFLKRVPTALKASAAGAVEALTNSQLDELLKQADIHSPDSIAIKMDLRRLGVLR